MFLTVMVDLLWSLLWFCLANLDLLKCSYGQVHNIYNIWNMAFYVWFIFIGYFSRLSHIIDLLENGSVVDRQDMVANLKYSIAVLDTLYIEETK